MRPLPLAVAAAAAITACGPQPVPPLTLDDFTLRGVPVESDSTELRLTFGEPDSITTSPNPFPDDAPLTTWHYDAFEIRFAGGDGPAGYLLHAPGERSARGIGVGDPAPLALRAYGQPDAQYVPSWTWIDDSDPAALRVIDVVVESDTVRRVYIGRVVD